MATVVTEIDIAGGLTDVAGFPEYEGALVLLRMRGRVVGTVRVPIRFGLIMAADLRSAIDANREVGDGIVRTTIDDWLLSPAAETTPPPSWTVVVCTRDRTEQLRECLNSLVAAGVTDGEVIVVDNGPSDDSTMTLVAGYPVRYVRTERAGLNHARALGARYATGDVVVYTDDDVIVDHHWIPAILQGFAGPRVAAVTGPGMPFTLATEAQELFERYCSFGRGFTRKEYDYTNITPAAAGGVGSGLNMAFRRDLIMSLGLFDAELDRGTHAITGGDTYAFYRVLSEGLRIVYVPDAMVQHVHRSEHGALRATMYGYGVGVFAFLTRCLLQHRDLNAARTGLAWFVRHHIRELARALLRRPGRFPIRLVLAEILGAVVGPFAYLRTRRAERKHRREAASGATFVSEVVGDEPARV